jgi:hypothetical protein
VPRQQWAELSDATQALIDAGAAPQSPEAHALAQQWQAMTEFATGGDPVLHDKLRLAYASEPLLQAGGPLTPAQRAFLTAATPAGA